MAVRRGRRTEVTASSAALADTGLAGTDLPDTGLAGTDLAGTGLTDGTRPGRTSSVPAAPMPPALVAAARRQARDVAVRLDVAGTEAIAIVGEVGDPRAWWTAIWSLAGPAREDR